MKKYFGPETRYEQEEELRRFYSIMNQDNGEDPSGAVYEWLSNAPCFDDFRVDKFRMWKDQNGEIIGAVRPASPWPGEVIINCRKLESSRCTEVIQYAEENFAAKQEGNSALFVVLFDDGMDMEKELIHRGYDKLSIEHVTAKYDLLHQEVPDATIPVGFTMSSLADCFDFDQLSRLIWEGFRYEGEIPKIDADVSKPIKHAWLDYRRELCCVILDEAGDYAAFCGIFLDEMTMTAYLEPMVVREKHRRCGLGKAVVYHSLQRLIEPGCKTVFVNPDDDVYDYYIHMGFRQCSYERFFQKSFK